MVKKFNENWGDIDDISGYKNSDIKAYPGEDFESAIRRAIKEAIRNNSAVSLVFDDMTFYVDKYTKTEELIKQRKKKISEKKPAGIKMFPLVGDNIDSLVKRAIGMADFKNTDVDFEFNKVYVRVNKLDNVENIKRKYLKDLQEKSMVKKPKDDHPYDAFINYLDHIKGKKYDDEDVYPVIGLPSGEVIYMNISQIKYFRVRDFICYVKKWKKPIETSIAKQYTLINIDEYCFNDKNVDQIIDLMGTITW